MALVLEDGTGLSTSNAFVSITEANAYFVARSDTTWTAVAPTDALKEGAILYATRILSNCYEWPGTILDDGATPQALAWPRNYAWDRDGRELLLVPSLVKDATCELAKFELSNPAATAVSRNQTLSSVSLGKLAVSFRDDAPTLAFLPFISKLLAPILIGSSFTARAIRG